jgi:RNA recognition motif-containing protein
LKLFLCLFIFDFYKIIKKKKKYKKLVIDKETESNKGTGFVKFKEPAVAKKLIEASESFERDGVKSSVIDLELTGRRLICFSAMKRKEIEIKLEEKKNLKEGPKIDLKKVKYLD